MSVHTIIVGGGLTGLIAARELQARGISYLLIEKSEAVGGRLSTSETDDGLADDGAQFFSAREADFRAEVQQWLDEDLVFELGTEWSDGSIKRTVPNAEMRYAVRGGMVKLAQNIAAGLHNVETSVSVQDIRYQGNMWYVTFGGDRVAEGKHLVLTPPVPISLALLADVPLDRALRIELERIHYVPNLTALFTVEGDTLLPESGGVQLTSEESDILRWVGDNAIKTERDSTHVLTVQARRIYSQKNYEQPDDVILAALQDALTPYLTEDANVTNATLKRWQYGSPLTTYPHETLANDDGTLIFAGDAFGGRARLEGAYLSGLAVAKRLSNVKEPTSQ